MHRSQKAAMAALLSLLLLSCSGKAGADSSGNGPTEANPRLATIELSVGGARLEAEVARTGGERERGLMFRKSLKEGEGMLFVFEADQRLAFWMKNTLVPLSVAYLSSDGTIREVFDLEPGSLEAKASERSLRYALEVPKGWFEKVGARVGDRIDLSALATLK